MKKEKEKGSEHAVVFALSFTKFYIFIYSLKFLCPFELETKELRCRRCLMRWASYRLRISVTHSEFDSENLLESDLKSHVFQWCKMNFFS